MEDFFEFVFFAVFILVFVLPLLRTLFKLFGSGGLQQGLSNSIQQRLKEMQEQQRASGQQGQQTYLSLEDLMGQANQQHQAKQRTAELKARLQEKYESVEAPATFNTQSLESQLASYESSTEGGGALTSYTEDFSMTQEGEAKASLHALEHTEEEVPDKHKRTARVAKTAKVTKDAKTAKMTDTKVNASMLADILSDRNALRNAFILQELLKRPE